MFKITIWPDTLIDLFGLQISSILSIRAHDLSVWSIAKLDWI